MKIRRIIPPAAAPVDLKAIFYGAAGFLKGEEYLKRLEREVREYFNVKHVFFVSSGKAALTVILNALKSLSPERDEVLIPAYTCFSVPSAIKKAGLKIALCDIEPETFDFQQGLLKNAINKKTLCVIPNHLFGIPSDVKGIINICRGKGIFVVEDAAQAMGGEIGGNKIGTIGDAGFFSLGRGKNITCGSGGIIVTSSDRVAEAINGIYSELEYPNMPEQIKGFLQLIAMNIFIRPSLYWFPSGLPHLKLGETIFYKDFPIKRLSGMNAGILCKWQESLQFFKNIRKETAKFLSECIGLQNSYNDTVLYPRLPFIASSKELRDKIYSDSREKGLGISLMYPTSINEVRELEGQFNGMAFPQAKMVSERLLTIPTHQFLGKKDKEDICRLFKIHGAISASDIQQKKLEGYQGDILSQGNMKLIITIDTEEDNWGNYSREGFTLKNIERIPALQQLFDDFNVKPTYLISYPVAADKKAVSIFKKILEKDKCEIGTHCHPWNTPPFEEETTEYNSMLCNLPADLQFRKIKCLHDAIRNNLGVESVSFRAGRWGYNQNVAKNLYKLGYKIDTSVTPFTDWREYHGPEFTNLPPRPFRFSSEDIFHESEGGEMLEVPVTVGFLQRNFKLCNNILKLTGQRPINYLRITGILYKLNIVNKVWLSPEGFDSRSMIGLAKSMMRNNFGIINMMFHSTALIHGLSPLVKTKDEEKKFFDRIRGFLRFTSDAGIESIRLSESLQLLQQ